MENLTALQNKVWDIVKRHGRASPITGKQIAETVDLKERDSGKEGADLRSIVHALRVKNYPVCASGDGYYVAQTSEELSKYIFSFEGRIAKEQAALEGLKQAFGNIVKPDPLNNTLSIPSNSIPAKEYKVETVDGKMRCSCPSYNFRKKCSHIEKAKLIAAGGSPTGELFP